MNLIEIDEPAVLIRINKAFRPKMTDKELYNSSRGRWKVNLENARKADYAIVLHKGIVQEVYKISEWKDASKESGLDDDDDFNGRSEFFGKPAQDNIREKYIFKSLKHYFAKGNSNPINYINI